MRDSIREKVLEVLKDGRYRTTEGIWYDGRFLPLRPADIRNELNLMVDEGLISKVRDNSITFYYISQPGGPQ
jgi:Fe2+ or Zn2+ uptake regulation protein